MDEVSSLASTLTPYQIKPVIVDKVSSLASTPNPQPFPPKPVIVDEVSSLAEVEAIRTMAQRGIRIIAAVHGNTLPMLLHDPQV